jgi:hypothetical protein
MDDQPGARASSPTITLNTYGHLFGQTADRAAQIMEATFSAVRSE